MVAEVEARVNKGVKLRVPTRHGLSELHKLQTFPYMHLMTNYQAKLSCVCVVVVQRVDTPAVFSEGSGGCGFQQLWA